MTGVSILDEDSLSTLKEAIWQLTGLLRVYLRHGNHVEEEPLALEPGTTIADAAQCIHKSLGSTFRHARIWGPSARFAGQQVGRNHLLADGDTIEIIN
jgi:ribosome-interacting GTPase 1